MSSSFLLVLDELLWNLQVPVKNGGGAEKIISSAKSIIFS